jgi:hypothetical protein
MTFRQALGHIQPLLQQSPWALSPGIKRPEDKDAHLHIELAVIPPLPHTFLWRLIKYRDNFTLNQLWSLVSVGVEE